MPIARRFKIRKPVKYHVLLKNTKTSVIINYLFFLLKNKIILYSKGIPVLLKGPLKHAKSHL